MLEPQATTKENPNTVLTYAYESLPYSKKGPVPGRRTRTVGPNARSLAQLYIVKYTYTYVYIYTYLYIYIYMYIYLTIYSCARDLAFGPTVRVRLLGMGPFFEYGGFFISIIQLNVRIFFGAGLRRHKFEYFRLTRFSCS